ncbi:unnamed protein product [Calicophoron daubneyi]|uniref:Uncharacterized protein n=1 Tax=Calicophoron daubneyi TaxID=300641 RepID=A0AAV2T9G6_CALDB
MDQAVILDPDSLEQCAGGLAIYVLPSFSASVSPYPITIEPSAAILAATTPGLAKHQRCVHAPLRPTPSPGLPSLDATGISVSQAHSPFSVHDPKSPTVPS